MRGEAGAQSVTLFVELGIILFTCVSAMPYTKQY